MISAAAVWVQASRQTLQIHSLPSSTWFLLPYPSTVDGFMSWEQKWLLLNSDYIPLRSALSFPVALCPCCCPISHLPHTYTNHCFPYNCKGLPGYWAKRNSHQAKILFLMPKIRANIHSSGNQWFAFVVVSVRLNNLCVIAKETLYVMRVPLPVFPIYSFCSGISTAWSLISFALVFQWVWDY